MMVIVLMRRYMIKVFDRLQEAVVTMLKSLNGVECWQ